jgi:hypothetical protein
VFLVNSGNVLHTRAHGFGEAVGVGLLLRHPDFKFFLP